MGEMPIVPLGGGASEAPFAHDVALQRPWQRGATLSSAASVLAERAEAFLATAGFDRAPWLAVVFAAGIFAWFALATPWQWMGAIGLALVSAVAAAALWRGAGERDHLRTAIISCGLVFAAGVAVIWLRSETVGAEPIARPSIERVQGYILEREEQPAQDRIRLTLAIRDAASGDGRKIRINVPLELARETE